VRIYWNEFKLLNDLDMTIEQLRKLPDTQIKSNNLFIPMMYQNSRYGLVILEPYDNNYLKDEEKITIYKLIVNALSLSIGALNMMDKLKSEYKMSSVVGRKELKRFYLEQQDKTKAFSIPIAVLKITVKNISEFIKTVNFEFSEDVIKFIQSILEYNTRAVDLVRRYDKGIFLVIMPGFDDVSSTAFVQQLEKEILREINDFISKHDAPSLKLSIDSFIYPAQKNKIDDLLK